MIGLPVCAEFEHIGEVTTDRIKGITMFRKKLLLWLGFHGTVIVKVNVMS